jgi:hypothetical protein
MKKILALILITITLSAHGQSWMNYYRDHERVKLFYADSLKSPTLFSMISTYRIALWDSVTKKFYHGLAISNYATLASPTFTGTPAAPTATGGTNTTQIATTAFVQSAIGGLTTATSGIYTPTLTSTSNLTASGTSSAQYIRIGNIVTVSGPFNATITSTGSSATGKLSLPVASDLAGFDLSGVITSIDGTIVGTITYDATNDKAIFQFKGTTTSNTSCAYTFSYEVH